MKITMNNFIGADAERLADCIKYAAKNDLTIDEDTQCGINDSSGNVWLWSDMWPACVYTTIGFETCMSCSCPNCGEEFDCDRPPDAETRNEYFNETEGCEICKPKEEAQL